jgi:GNAT superfamily N-acetyltransferase
MTPIIRRAIEADARAIMEAHVSSVRNLCGPFHTPQQITAWIGQVQPENYRQAMVHGEKMFVAEDEGQIIGFSSVQGSELRAVYVHPDHVRRKIGTALLTAAERFAFENGCTELTMDASVNSEMFYRHCGYRVVGRSVHRFQDGTEVPCVRMSKVR